MNRIIRLSYFAVIGLALLGCGGGADAVKKVEPVTPEQKAELDQAHQAAIQGSSGSAEPAKQQ